MDSMPQSCLPARASFRSPDVLQYFFFLMACFHYKFFRPQFWFTSPPESRDCAPLRNLRFALSFMMLFSPSPNSRKDQTSVNISGRVWSCSLVAVKFHYRMTTIHPRTSSPNMQYACSFQYLKIKLLIKRCIVISPIDQYVKMGKNAV